MIDSLYKKLVTALFKLSGGQAMPNYSSPIEHSGKGTYVAPYDGYIQVHTVAGAEIDESQLSINNTRIANMIALLGGNWLDFIVPVHKGDNCLVNATGENSSVTVRFYKTVGGAKSLLAMVQAWIRGGALCLLTSSIFSARSLSSRQRKESLTQFILKQQEQERAHTLLSPHRVTVGCLHQLTPPLKMGFREFEYTASGTRWRHQTTCLHPHHLVKNPEEALVQSTFPFSRVCRAVFGQKTELISFISSLLTSQLVSVFNKEVCHA